MIVVTATSFMRDKGLCLQLERELVGRTIHYFDLREPDQKKAFLAQADVEAWLVGGERVSAAELGCFPKLRIISKYGVGIDNIDFGACAERNIQVAWEPGVNCDAVAEHCIGLMLAAARKIAVNSRSLAQGQWVKNGGRNLSGMKVGIVGLGHIGTRVAELLKAFRCDLRFCDIVDKGEIAAKLGLQASSYEDLLSWAELITFHVPLTPATHRMLDKAAIARTQRGVFIVNTSRGAVIDQDALYEALDSGHIGGAGLDVYEIEPLGLVPLAMHEGLVGTPHTAGNSVEAVQAMGTAAIEGLKKGLKKADDRVKPRKGDKR